MKFKMMKKKMKYLKILILMNIMKKKEEIKEEKEEVNYIVCNKLSKIESEKNFQIEKKSIKKIF
jgi:hypothetical protein